jgi:hypothetical protein
VLSAQGSEVSLKKGIWGRFVCAGTCVTPGRLGDALSEQGSEVSPRRGPGRAVLGHA